MVIILGTLRLHISTEFGIEIMHTQREKGNRQNLPMNATQITEIIVPPLLLQKFELSSASSSLRIFSASTIQD